MNAPDDQQLLREFDRHRSEAAFAELVRRHVDLVYSAAFRMTGEAHSAQDVTQSAFVALAQNAGRLVHHPVLCGWLHGVARNLAANVIRSDVRRRAREQEAAAMNELISNAPDASWEEIAPHLDAALGELGESDRDAVMLRYFEKKTAAEIAAQLGISDDAAQKRVSRAVERLREIFAKQKITIGAGGLTILISANAVQSAPVGLAVAISAAALAGTAAATSTTIAAATKTIAMTTLQKTLVTATVAVLAGAGIYEARQAAQLRDQVQTLQQQQAPLAEQLQQLQLQQDSNSNRVVWLKGELAKNEKNNSELLKLRGEVGVLRSQLELLKLQSTQQIGGNGKGRYAGNLISKNQLAPAGFQTPESAFQSYMSAMLSGQYDQVLTTLPPSEASKEGKEQFDAHQKDVEKEKEDFQGIQMLSKKTITDDKVDLQVVIFENGKAPDITIQHMVRVGNEWKAAGGSSYADWKDWNQATNIEPILPFADQ